MKQNARHSWLKRTVSLILVLFLLAGPLSALAVPEDPTQQYYELTWIDMFIQYYSLFSDGTESRLPEGLGPEDFAPDKVRFYEILQDLTKDFDQFSAFLLEEEYHAYFPSIETENYTGDAGIGVMVEDLSWGTFVKMILPGSAAEEAGILAGDQICAVDGVDVRGFSLGQATPLLKDRKSVV